MAMLQAPSGSSACLRNKALTGVLQGTRRKSSSVLARPASKAWWDAEEHGTGMG
jgi:hypothetical protein